ncbi:MAG: hypothetical protein R8K21_07615, partial [Mariprofundales bacterium]
IDIYIKSYYESTIKLALIKKVNVFIILYPQSKEYFEEILFQNNIILESFINQLAKNPNVYILDYRNLFVDREYLF